MNLFRTLRPKEIEDFRNWARENYKPFDEIKSIWHPVTQLECAIINLKESVKIYNNELRKYLNDNNEQHVINSIRRILNDFWRLLEERKVQTIESLISLYKELNNKWKELVKIVGESESKMDGGFNDSIKKSSENLNLKRIINEKCR